MLKFAKQHKTWTIIFASMLLFILVVYITATDTRIQVTRYAVRSEELPEAFDGMTIMQLSDLHGQITDRLYDLILENKPSIFVLTGDTVDEDTEDYDGVCELLQVISDGTPTFLITGNHEQWLDNTDEVLQMFADCGAKIMDGKSASLKLGDDRIYITGIADPSFVDDELCQSTLLRQKKLTAQYDGFNILLFHRADMFDSFLQRGYDLILSGHMHGGQVRVPFVGGIISPKGSWMPKYSGGMYKLEDGSVGISNRGLANGGRIKRIYNRPEIVIIELQCAE